MSGIIVNNVARASGTIAATPGGLDWSTAVVTGSTVTVEAGKGYFINTTSNACTVTLPASADPGDQIVLADYARTWATNAVTLDSNGNNFQGDPDTYTVDYDTVGQSLNIVYADSTKGWLPVSDDAVAFDHTAPPTQKGIFGFGGNAVSITNLVSSSGVISADVTGVGTARSYLAAANYGGDKAVFAYGLVDGQGFKNMSNKVSNSGVVATDTTGVGTARAQLGAATYGGDKAIFAYGDTGSVSSLKNLVNNSGTFASDVAGVGTARAALSAAEYGGDKAIFGFGFYSPTGITNLVSNIGVVASDTSAVGTARGFLGGAKYGGDKAIFAFGINSGSARVSLKNLVTNQGVVGSDVTGVGTARYDLAATNYGGDKAVFAYGQAASGYVATKNLVNNLGVVASDVSGVGTARNNLSAAGYSASA